MLKAMIEKIEKMAGPKVFDIGDEHFASSVLMRIDPKKDFPKSITLTGLDSVCKMVVNEANDLFPGDQVLIQLRSLYIPNDDTKYLLKLLSSVSKESKVSSNDNGVSQTVEARTGVALTTNVEVRPYVNLQPFRTFLEVQQPESMFLLRLDNDGKVALIEADGGVWKLEATRNIAAYFDEKLGELITAGRVVVLR